MYYKYPVEALNGDILTHADDSQAIADALKSALLTETGERVLRPEYGLPSLHFEALNPKVTSTINTAIETGLKGFDMVYTLTTSVADDGYLLANIGYENRNITIKI